MKNLTENDVYDIAKKAWDVAQVAIAKRSIPMSFKGNKGFMLTVNGGATKLVKLAADQKNMNLTKSQTERVRSYLKSSGHVVSVSQSDENKYEWNLFIAEKWTGTGLVLDTISLPKHSARVEHETDVMTRGESGPVEVSNVMDEFKANPLGEMSARIIERLHRHGGRYDHGGKNFTINDMMGEYATISSPPSSSLSILEERGLVKRTAANSRRWKCIKLTTRGRLVADQLHYAQASIVGVAYTVRMLGEVESAHGELVKDVASLSNSGETAASDSLMRLHQAGLIHVERDNRQVMLSAKWVGKGEMPGVLIDPEWPDHAPVEDIENGATQSVLTPDPDAPSDVIPAPVAADRDAHNAAPADVGESAPLARADAVRFARDEAVRIVAALTGVLTGKDETQALREELHYIKSEMQNVLDFLDSFANGKVTIWDTIGEVEKTAKRIVNKENK